MAAKRIFPPEWYAAQAARRKKSAEAKAQKSSNKEVVKEKSKNRIYEFHDSKGTLKAVIKGPRINRSSTSKKNVSDTKKFKSK